MRWTHTVDGMSSNAKKRRTEVQGDLGGGANTELWSMFLHTFILISLHPAASQHDLQCEGEVNSLISGWKSQPVVTTRCLPAPNKLLPEPRGVYLR